MSLRKVVDRKSMAKSVPDLYSINHHLHPNDDNTITTRGDVIRMDGSMNDHDAYSKRPRMDGGAENWDQFKFKSNRTNSNVKSSIAFGRMSPELDEPLDLSVRRVTTVSENNEFAAESEEKILEAKRKAAQCARQYAAGHYSKMNKAFEELRTKIPKYSNDQNLTKLTTIQVAIAYIRYLKQIIGTDHGQTIADIKNCWSNVLEVLPEEGRTRITKTKRLKK